MIPSEGPVGPDGESGSPATGPRILLLSYHFPPSQATGSVRWEYFARFAAERGWGIDVVTLDPADVDAPNWDRVRALPDDVRIFGVGERTLLVERLEQAAWKLWRTIRGLVPSGRADGDAGRPGKGSGDLTRPLTYPRDDLPGLLASPRSILRAFWAWRKHAVEKAWARDAGRTARRVFDPEAHRVVVTCGPPHLVHWAGRRLSEATGTPLVLDFRDAWSVAEVVAEELASPVWARLASGCERSCVERASLVVANTEPLRDRMGREYPEADSRIVAVYNGFDECDVEGASAVERFVIAYAGAIYLNRDPRPLMQAVARVVQRRKLSPDDLTLEFMGHVESFGGTPLTRLAEEAGVRSHLRLHPPSSREEAMEFMRRATVLVSLPQELEMAIPSKIFDYMQFNAWIVAQARRGSASEKLLRDTRAAVVPPDDVEEIADVLGGLHERYADGERPSPLGKEHPELSRRAQAQRLFRELDPLRE